MKWINRYNTHPKAGQEVLIYWDEEQVDFDNEGNGTDVLKWRIEIARVKHNPIAMDNIEFETGNWHGDVSYWMELPQPPEIE